MNTGTPASCHSVDLSYVGRTMTKNIETLARPIGLPEKPVLTEDLDAAIQDTLTMLADVDREYEQRREAIKKSPITNERNLSWSRTSSCA